MSDTAQKIYDHFKNQKQFFFSKNVSTRNIELDAINELEDNGYIIIKMKTIGYVIADIL